MADTSILVSGIEYKVRNLIENNIRLTDELESLRSENKSLHQHIKELEQHIDSLTQKINKNIVSNSLEGEKEIKEGRKLISDLVREIDQCIALLSR